MFDERIQQAIIAHADREALRTKDGREAPHECCGFILADGTVMACANVHPDPQRHFRIAARDRAQAEQIGIKALYHSHVFGWRDFSPDDIRLSRREQLPLYLYHQRHPEFFYFDPAVTLPYKGREFHFAYANCYDLVRDWYRQELGIELRECYPDEPGIWDQPDFDPIALINPLEQGFLPLPKDVPIAKHDVLQMRIGKQKRACHLGVIVNPDRNQFLHHLSDRLSGVDVYGGDWAEDTERVWRHKSLC